MRQRFTYDCVLIKEDDGYCASFPQIPGAFADGDTRERLRMPDATFRGPSKFDRRHVKDGSIEMDCMSTWNSAG